MRFLKLRCRHQMLRVTRQKMIHRSSLYYIYQNVPSQSATSYYAKSLSIESEVDASFKLNNVKITDEEHNDVK